jgi:hypothetical protein
MAVEVSWFAIASIVALGIFMVAIIPRALGHLAAVAGRLVLRRRAEADPWLIAIAGVVLVCAGLVVGMAAFADRAQRLLHASAAVTFAFLFFALPAVLQVLRAWGRHHAHRPQVLSHLLVALAVLSLPASMAFPTAALMQATQGPAPASAPAGAGAGANPIAAYADGTYFTDNGVANDPVDYPAAAFLERDLSWHVVQPAPRPGHRHSFYRDIPAFTAFWFDETTNMLAFDAPNSFGVLISRITNVPANWAFALAVEGYKLLCALVLVAVTFDVFLRPMADRIRRVRRRRDEAS